MIEEILQKLSTEELVGQLLCYEITDKDDPSEVEKLVKRTKPGGLFLMRMTAEKIKMYTDMVNKYTRVPVIISSDVENGPDAAILGAGSFPHQMAWGACDNPELLRQAGRETAKICRKGGVHWTFSPIVDINYAFRSPQCNIRTVSDDPKQVVKMTKAFMEGLQEKRYMLATCKHFPGEGVDERNSHFCTTVNTMTKEEWMSTYGYVYKEMIAAGAPSIMVGHGALPAFEKDIDPFFGAPPAVLSRSLMTDLLKGELGFDGCIVSDAICMIGVASRVENLDKLAVQFINAGGDVVLFPEECDFDNLLLAARSGEIPRERLLDAVRRFLRLKERARLFEDQKRVCEEIEDETDFPNVAQKIADGSVTVVRDLKNIIPLSLPKGGKVLMLNIVEPYGNKPPTNKELDAMKDEFEKHGYTVDVISNAKHKQVKEIMNDYDLICLNSLLSSQTYHGGTMRIGWNNIMVLWRGYLLQHPHLICTSFGDPYKLYDMPYLKEYINAYSHCDASQRAVVKLILGEIESKGKNPVDFQPYFKREV